MPKILYFSIVLLLKISVFAQNPVVNGEILQQDSALTVMRVWGTHDERGFAYGYLAGEKILAMYDGYIRESFGDGLETAKRNIANGIFTIDTKYITEAKAIVRGMAAAGTDVSDFDYLDILPANSFLDISMLMKNGCSTLMSWGDATDNDELHRAVMATRFMDWDIAPELMYNNLILIHIPSEPDEQPWLLVGYAGQIGVLSGANKAGLCVFQHVMFDELNFPTKAPEYEPIWFSLRRSLEQKDPDGNGQSDVNDVRFTLAQNKKGYADGFIVAAISTQNAQDDLAAMVAELAPCKPFNTFRTNTYDDQISGDNLYAANSPIARQDAKSYCSRYFKIYKNIAENQTFTSSEHQKLMAQKSNADGTMQAMQIIPSLGILRFSSYKNAKPAYRNTYQTFDLNKLFEMNQK